MVVVEGGFLSTELEVEELLRSWGGREEKVKRRRFRYSLISDARWSDSGEGRESVYHKTECFKKERWS
jgi:hypothetical protein